MFDLIPQDKATHEVYGARIGAVAAAAAYVAAFAIGWPKYALPAAAAAAAVLALAAGLAKEQLDKRANARAHDEGLPPPHSVESADAVATLLGGVVVALPLVAAWLTAQQVWP